MIKQRKLGTVVASFGTQEQAINALERLRGVGFTEEEAYLVPRDEFNEGFGSNAEARANSDIPNAEHHGFKHFLNRFFGITGVETEPVLSKRSETFLSDAYKGEQPLLVIHAPIGRLGDARTLLTAEGAILDEEAIGVISEDAEKTRTMRLHAETLVPHTETVPMEDVVVRKDVITETRTVEVPVSHEELVVERRPISAREGTSETIAAASEMEPGEEIRMQLTKEEVVVEKRTVPTEEVVLSKKSVQETAKVSDTVRHEEAHIEHKNMPVGAVKKPQNVPSQPNP